MIEKNLENDSDQKLPEVIDITSEETVQPAVKTNASNVLDVIDNKVSSKSATENLTSVENLEDSKKPLNAANNQIETNPPGQRKMRYLMTARKSTNPTKSVKKLKTDNEDKEDFIESDDGDGDDDDDDISESDETDNSSEEDIVEESKPEVVTETAIVYGKDAAKITGTRCKQTARKSTSGVIRFRGLLQAKQQFKEDF